jgi:hypothetical protein
MRFQFIGRTVVRSMRSADAELVRGLQGRAADAADNRRAVAAGKRIGDLAGALRAIEEQRLRVG